MTQRFAPNPEPASATRLLSLACIPLLMGLAAGVNAAGNNVDSIGGTLVLGPGDTGLCRAAPCGVQFKMPAGTGSYEVLSDTMSIGTFPAGETVNLGQFYNSHEFTVKGTDAAPAYFYVQ